MTAGGEGGGLWTDRAGVLCYLLEREIVAIGGESRLTQIA